MLWYFRLSHCLQCWHPMSASSIPSRQFAIQLPANTAPGRAAQDGRCTCVPAETQMEFLAHVFLPLVHTPIGRNSQGWGRLKPISRNSVWVDRSPSPWSILYCLLSFINSELVLKWSRCNLNRYPYEMLTSRLAFNPMYHKAGPLDQFYFLLGFSTSTDSSGLAWLTLSCDVQISTEILLWLQTSNRHCGCDLWNQLKFRSHLG